MKSLKALIQELALNPAAVLYAVNALIAMSVTWGWHLTAGQAGALDTITTGVLSLTAAFLVRPVVVSAAVAAAVTVFTAFTAFGLHAPAAGTGTAAAAASVLLGALLHAIGIPAVAAKQGKTATQIMLERPRSG